MTPCSHSHSTKSGVLWPVRLSHTSNSRSGGRSSGRVKGRVRPACHTVHAARVTAGSSDEPGEGSAARMSLRRSRSHGCRTALVPRVADCSRTWPEAGWNRVRILVVPPRMYCRGCIHAAGWPVALAAATTHRDAAPPETGRLRPHTKRTAPVGRPVCRPARSAPFYRRIGIANAHHAVLALAHRDAGLAPGAALLPAQASFVQGAPDRKGADLWQPVIRLAQGFLQQAQGPRGRAVLLAPGRAGPFGQNALLRVSPIADPWSAPMARPHGGEPVAVEAADPGGNRL